VADFTGTPGFLVVYGYDGLVAQLPPSRVRQVNYPYAGLLKLGTVDYVSAANVSGCEKCHTVPYLKHGNILGQVDNVATDLITCKACHLDNGDGGHQVWQLLVDDTVKAGDYWALNPGGVEEEMTLAELAKYAYKTRLMNDVHMSHAMEFEYPQSMANCNTCHAGKLNAIFADANFNFETCKSCHAVTGSAQSEKPQPSLADVVPHTLTGRENCYGGHAGAFKTVTGHTGYDKVIYGTDNGVKYSDVIKVTIDNASLDNTNKLTISFSSTGTLGGLVTPNIKPTVLVGLYGYDTKDYIVGPHERNFDDNGDGKIDSDDSRNLEYVVGATHPRFTFDNTTPGGSWKVTANLSPWAGMISAGSVKRVEIGVMPALKNPNNDNALVALDAPSKTFDLKTKKFVKFYPEIVKVATGCNNCHDALATTFHSADRGGNIVVCRLCHITKSGGSHLEMQSRSIDSYAHAIHTFQDFDIGDIDFDNNVESMFHELKIESHYPTFDTTNCTSCHNAGTFNVPDQAKSLAGILSASDEKTDENQTLNRMITGVPTYVSGPASRACGACHRAELIKEDAASELASFNQHTKDGGYLLEPGNIPTLTAAINAIMPMFYDDVMVVLP
jgi:OmcA/MtrC family decaheme c-type cytochrome